MKTATKIIASLLLLIVFISACAALMVGTFAGLFLHTFQVFTDKRPIAELSISEQKTDQYGEYADVSLKIINRQSTALTWALLNNKSDFNAELPVQNFKVYGDFVYVGGPIVRFNDNLTLLNFQTMFKLVSLSGEYKFDLDKEKGRPEQAFSKFQFNGGYDDWKPLFNNWKQTGILGDVYRSFIQTTTDNEVGTDIIGRSMNYIVYITNGGFQIEVAR
ncbi:MAG: hypothetical protein ACMG57_05875 [Candidatus Dojkabacteria bacterium]